MNKEFWFASSFAPPSLSSRHFFFFSIHKVDGSKNDNNNHKMKG